MNSDIDYQKFENSESWSKYIKRSEKQLKIVHLNIRSLRKHFNEFLVLTKQCEVMIDIIILSEINIKTEEATMYKIDGYKMFCNARQKNKGGGVLIYAKEELNFDADIHDSLASEILYGKLNTGKHTLHIISLYRPPKTNKLRFIEEINLILKSIPTKEDILLIGDTNLDLLRDNLNSTLMKYKTTLCEHGLQCAIPTTEITREAIVDGRLETSCIDHVWVRVPRDPCVCAHLLTCRISDHHLIGTCFDTVPDVNVLHTNGLKVECALNNKLIRDKLDKVEWVELLGIECPLVLYQKLSAIFGSIYESSKIEVTLPNRRKTQPWINRELRVMLDRRDALFRTWKSTPKSLSLRLEYTRYRNRVNTLINVARNEYRQKQITNCSGDFRKIWSNINSWLGRTKTSLDSVIMKYLGKSDNLKSICSKFSNTFTQEIQGIKHNCDVKFLQRDTYVKQANVSFRFRKVSAWQIERIIDKLSSEKAPGIDRIRVQDIKYIKSSISNILAKFVNMCASRGTYPDDLKKSLIRPIYKQGSHLEYTNYRPIAILSVINKIVEKVLVKQVSEFLEHYKLISNSQHGFRKGRSTSTALGQFTDDVNESLDSGKQVVALFIDYKKAFDTLDHNQLLQAMKECGIRGPTNDWFRSYLSNRTLQTKIAGTIGLEAAVQTGVPTGSVYGPVGYIMHVNSVCNVIKKCKVYMYADDMCLIYASRDINEAKSHIQSDLENVTKWAHDNGIIINLNKTKCMHIYSPYNKKAKNENSCIDIVGHTFECLHRDKYNCKCMNIEFVKKFKYLGLTIDYNFSWKTHVMEVCNKLRSVLSKFAHLKKVLNKNTLYMVYYALADSLLSYGLSSYGRTFKTYLDQIKQLQIRFLKYLINTKDIEYDKLFPKCKILPVHVKFKLLVAIEQYNCNDYKVYRSSSHITRSIKNKKLLVPKFKNYYGQRTRQYLTPKIYNSIPFLLECTNLCKVTIKNKLKQFLLKDI